MAYSAYIFDMDGTLVNNMGVHADVWTELLASLGHPTERETFIHRTIGKVNSEILREFVSPDLSDAEIATLSRRKEELYRQRFRPLLKEVPGLHRYLELVAAQGIPMALATSAGRENVNYVLEGLGIQAFFRVQVTADEVINGKPDPEIFLKAAGELEVAPEKCLVFEDSPSGLEAARRAGMPAVALTTTYPAEKLSGQPAVMRIIPNYVDLPVF
jgi:beta-phosphoglucomutase family hydrolase